MPADAPGACSRRHPAALQPAGARLAAAPAIMPRDATRPAVPYGVQVGDVVGRPGDRLEPGRPAGADAGALGDHREHGRVGGGAAMVNALEDRDFTAKVDLAGLPRASASSTR